MPHLEGVQRVAVGAEVRLVRRDDVVEAPADQPEGHGPDRDVRDGPGAAAALHPALVAEPDADEDADDDAECVAAQRDRAEMHDTGRRAGNECEVHGRTDATAPGGVGDNHTRQRLRNDPGYRAMTRGVRP